MVFFVMTVSAAEAAVGLAISSRSIANANGRPDPAQPAEG